MWYTGLIKLALRKNNLRVDFRVYPGDDLEVQDPLNLKVKIKQILSSAIIRSLDLIAIVSKQGIEPGNYAKEIAITSNLDIKVIAGQDYITPDGFNAVFYEIKQNIKPGLPIANAIAECRKQGGKFMVYGLSKKSARTIEKWKSSPYAPDFVEIWNDKSRLFRDMDIEYPEVMSSAATTSRQLEDSRVYTEMTRKDLQALGFLGEDEGVEYTPGYLSKSEEVHQ